MVYLFIYPNIKLKKKIQNITFIVAKMVVQLFQ